jgi:hypothetical protein
VSDDGCRPSHSVRYPCSQSSYQSSYFTVFHMLPSSKPSQSIVKNIGYRQRAYLVPTDPLLSRPHENIHPVTAARPVEVVLLGGGAASESVAGLSLLGSAVLAMTSSSTVCVPHATRQSQTHHTHLKPPATPPRPPPAQKLTGHRLCHRSQATRAAGTRHKHRSLSREPNIKRTAHDLDLGSRSLGLRPSRGAN